MKKICMFLLAAALLLSMISCSLIKKEPEPVEPIEIDLGLDSVKKVIEGDKTYLVFSDVSSTATEDDSAFITQVAGVGFRSKSDFYNAVTAGVFTSEQRRSLSQYVTAENNRILVPEPETITELSPREDDVLSTIRWYGGDSYSIRYDTDSYYYYFSTGIDYETAHNFYLLENALKTKNQIHYTENGIHYTQYDYIGAVSGEYMRLLRWDYETDEITYSVLQTVSEMEEEDIQTSGRSGYETFTLIIDDGDTISLVDSGTCDVLKSVLVDETFVTSFVPQAMVFSE